MEYFNVVGEEGFNLGNHKPNPVHRASEYKNLSLLSSLFKYRSLEKNVLCALDFNKNMTKKGKEKFEEAFMSISDELIKACYYHCNFIMFTMFEGRKLQESTGH